MQNLFKNEFLHEIINIAYNLDRQLYMKDMMNKIHTYDCIIFTYFNDSLPDKYTQEQNDSIEHACFQLWHDLTKTEYNILLNEACSISIIGQEINQVQFDRWVNVIINHNIQSKYDKMFRFN